MISYIIGRLLQAVPVLALASIAVFSVLRLIPGDPADIIAGEDATPAEVQVLREQLGLSDPIPVQYVRWIGELARGDLGVSLRTGVPVTELRAAHPQIEFEVAQTIGEDARVTALLADLATGA